MISVISGTSDITDFTPILFFNLPELYLLYVLVGVECYIPPYPLVAASLISVYIIDDLFSGGKHGSLEENMILFTIDHRS